MKGNLSRFNDCFCFLRRLANHTANEIRRSFVHHFAVAQQSQCSQHSSVDFRYYRNAIIKQRNEQKSQIVAKTTQKQQRRANCCLASARIAQEESIETDQVDLLAANLVMIVVASQMHQIVDGLFDAQQTDIAIEFAQRRMQIGIALAPRFAAYDVIHAQRWHCLRVVLYRMPLLEQHQQQQPTNQPTNQPTTTNTHYS